MTGPIWRRFCGGRSTRAGDRAVSRGIARVSRGRVGWLAETAGTRRPPWSSVHRGQSETRCARHRACRRSGLQRDRPRGSSRRPPARWKSDSWAGRLRTGRASSAGTRWRRKSFAFRSRTHGSRRSLLQTSRRNFAAGRGRGICVPELDITAGFWSAARAVWR